MQLFCKDLSMKNKITFTFIFTLLVVAGLLALYYLPPVNLNGTPLRKVDLLSDLRPDPVVEEVSDSDSIPLPVVAKPVFVDTCKTGMTCIEDYTDSLGLGMGAFYEALENRASLGRPVRIAYFGDSFIEGDILTADLRSLLQQKFGGRGSRLCAGNFPCSWIPSDNKTYLRRLGEPCRNRLVGLQTRFSGYFQSLLYSSCGSVGYSEGREKLYSLSGYLRNVLLLFLLARFRYPVCPDQRRRK